MSKILLPVLTSLLFSGSYVAGKYTTQDLGPLTVTLLRYTIAAAFLALLIPYQGRERLKLTGADVVVLVAIGLSGIVGYHYFFFSSLRYTEVANTAIINATSPILTGFAAAVLLRERLTHLNYLGIAVAFIGVVILLTRGETTNLGNFDLNRGDLLMLLAVVCWVVYALLVKSCVAKLSEFTITFYSTLLGVVALLVITPAEQPIQQLHELSRRSIYAVLYMGIAASGLGYLLYATSIRTIGATRTAGIVYSLVPVFVAALGFVFFDEDITLSTVSAMFLVLVGVHLLLSTPAPKVE